MQSNVKGEKIDLAQKFRDGITLSRSIVSITPNINESALSRMILVLAVAFGIFLRIWQINAMGFNTDEAVYAGQAAAIAGVPVLKDIFPIFRAHPLLFQFILSVIYKIHFSDLLGRLLAASVGIATILLTYQLGKTLYGRLAGALASAYGLRRDGAIFNVVAVLAFIGLIVAGVVMTRRERVAVVE